MQAYVGESQYLTWLIVSLLSTYIDDLKP